MICALVCTSAGSEEQPLFGSLWLFYVIVAGRANSNDLEIPGREKSLIYFLRLSLSKETILECNSR